MSFRNSSLVVHSRPQSVHRLKNACIYFQFLVKLLALVATSKDMPAQWRVLCEKMESGIRRISPGKAVPLAENRALIFGQ
ncbi:MAG TPA: hypothetical protein DGH68_01830 [Bacteroidetes bacterium]|nr:hypothetical protein [Bacteroidota bacterium]